MESDGPCAPVPPPFPDRTKAILIVALGVAATLAMILVDYLVGAC
jgi:hypothetical protein